MDNLSSFLMSMAGPIAKQVLLSLGIGLVSYIGIDFAVNQALGFAKASFTGMPASVLAILSKAGFATAFSILSGGIIAGATAMTFSKFSPVTSKV